MHHFCPHAFSDHLSEAFLPDHISYTLHVASLSTHNNDLHEVHYQYCDDAAED